MIYMTMTIQITEASMMVILVVIVVMMYVEIPVIHAILKNVHVLLTMTALTNKSQFDEKSQKFSG